MEWQKSLIGIPALPRVTILRAWHSMRWAYGPLVNEPMITTNLHDDSWGFRVGNGAIEFRSREDGTVIWHVFNGLTLASRSSYKYAEYSPDSLHEAIVSVLGWERYEGVDYLGMDPGVRETVRMLHEAGFDTTDSGDASKEEWYEAVVIPHAHVVVATELGGGERASECLEVLLPGWTQDRWTHGSHDYILVIDE